VVDALSLDAPKTSAMRDVLRNLVGDSSALVLMADRNDAVENSVRNLSNAQTLRASYLNIRDLFSHDQIIIPQAALDVIQSYLGTASETE
jgi:large subunit ribosomal protein L4